MIVRWCVHKGGVCLLAGTHVQCSNTCPQNPDYNTLRPTITKEKKE